VIAKIVSLLRAVWLSVARGNFSQFMQANLNLEELTRFILK